MGWIAVAATIDNIILAVHDDILVLETIAEMDFGTIVKIYGLSDDEIRTLKSGNLEYRIRFNNLRSTYLEPFARPPESREMSEIYSRRAAAFISMRGRFEHALNKHRAVLSHMNQVYQFKHAEALEILQGRPTDGFVSDYARELGMDTREAAALVIAKHDDMQQHLRKIELLRIRHFGRLKSAKTKADFDLLASEMDKDFFINMLM